MCTEKRKIASAIEKERKVNLSNNQGGLRAYYGMKLKDFKEIVKL